MFNVVNRERSTFTSSDPVLITDMNGKCFYFHKNEQGQITFNLPKGSFKSEGKIFREKSFLPYPEKIYILKKHFPFEHDKGYSYREGKNQNKGSIKYADKDILIDESIRKLYYPCFEFVLGHELGHTLFKDERLCDFYAHDRMLDLGYNPIQIKVAKNILFNKNLMRKNCIENHFQKYKTRR